MNQKRKGEFQGVEYGDYFTFGDLKGCPNTSLKDWAKEQPWYDSEAHLSFIDAGDCWVGIPQRIAIIEEATAFVYCYIGTTDVGDLFEWDR